MSLAESVAEALRIQTETLRLMQNEISELRKAQAAPGHTMTAPAGINIPGPPPLDIHSNPEESFKMFKAAWDNYCVATGMSQWPAENENKKVSILLNAIGQEGLKKYDNFSLSEANKQSCKSVLAVMENKLVPEKNVIYCRYLFNSRNQQTHETFEEFYTDLQKLVEDCEYKSFKEDLLRDKIVIGVTDVALKKELLRRKDLTLEQAINLCRSNEATERQLKYIAAGSEGLINKIVKKSKYKQKCRYCGDPHPFVKGACPAIGQVCEQCGKKNHFKKVCRSKNPRKVQEIKEFDLSTSGSDSENIVQINKISSGPMGMPQVCLELRSKKKWIKAECDIDTGADVNIIGQEEAIVLLGEQTLKKYMRPSNHSLHSFGGHKIVVLGDVRCLCRVKKGSKYQKYQIVFTVVENKHGPLLSCSASQVMGLIKFCKKVEQVKEINLNRKEAEKIVDKYKHIFEGYGQLPGEIDLEIDKSIKPVIQKARRIPISLRKTLKQELNRLETENIIEREYQHTDWVSNLLLLNRDNKLRICLDPIPLNKAIKRPNFQFTTIEEILPELGNAKVFTTVDAKKGFWQIGLSEDSSKLTTFWTPFGRYKWKVLPFGINAAPEHFQQKMQEVINDLPGIEMMADDILIYGKGETMEIAIQDHNKNLERLFERLEKFNCRLNKQKMNLLQTEVKFYGHLFTNEGIKPDVSKVEAIQRINAPQNKKELLSFLGMITYLSRFIPNLSAASRQLRELTLEKKEWIWTEEAQREFDSLKSLVANIDTLKYYDVTKPLTIECDSSSTALGVAVYQEDKVVAYASRTLNATERRYAQIEKELLAVLFACTRFDQYIIGNKETVIKTDHRPLINIFNKPLIQSPKRLQIMLLALQRYRFQLRFVSGKENVVADMLSRSFPKEIDDKIQGRKMQIFQILQSHNPLESLPVSDKCLKEIEDQSENDSTFTRIKHYILNGWPKYISDVPEDVKPYFQFKEELSVYGKLILRNNTILIPFNMRKEMLHKLHTAHTSLESCLKLARDAVFWPSMSCDIKFNIQSCSICVKYLPKQQHFPMQTHQIPDYPWQFVSMDVFFARDIKYLVTVDHYSDYFELDRIRDLTAAEVIKTCKNNFARHGVPERVCTDGASNFVCREFEEFSLKWNFEHVTSSPNHPQGNGKAESAVKIAKKLINKSSDSGEDLWYTILHWRNTPNKINSSPVQRLFSRRTRTSLPMIKELYKPIVQEKVSETIKNRRQQVKAYYDKSSKKAPYLETGQPVVVQLQPATNKCWTPGTVEKKLSDRSYIVRVNDTPYRRDLSHIRPFCDTNNQPEEAVPIRKSGALEGDASMEDEGSSLHRCDFQASDASVENQESSLNRNGSVDSRVIPESSTRPKRVTKPPNYLKDYIV